jgi:hypothetical protein
VSTVVVVHVIVDNGYQHANLARHLVSCGETGVSELTAVLLDFRWATRQLAFNGLPVSYYALPQLPILHPSTTLRHCNRRRKPVARIQLDSGAVQQALESGHKNSREVGFQLHGHLFASVELHEERPWLRSIDSFLEIRTGQIVSASCVGMIVKCVPIPRSPNVVITGCEGLLGILNTAAGDLVQSLQGHRGTVNPGGSER